jgi:hypothetical protein
VEQEQVIITYRSVKADLILTTEDFGMGMVRAPTSIALLPYRTSWHFFDRITISTSPGSGERPRVVFLRTRRWSKRRMGRYLNPRTVCAICFQLRVTVTSEPLTTSKVRILTVSHSCRLVKLARLATPNRVCIMERIFPEDWVHDTSRLVVVGSAAHPWPVRRSLPLLYSRPAH